MAADDVEAGSVHDRVLSLLERYGHNTTSFQTLEPGLEYWFDQGDTACVAYVDTGAAWVVAGGPIAEHSRENDVAERFVAHAREHGKRVRFFAAESECIAEAGLQLVHIGEQPVWDPTHWPEILRKKRSLREQLRRARAKGVIVRRPTGAEMEDPDSATRRGVDTLVGRWRDTREMAPMGFVVQIDLYTFPDRRRFFVAERDGAVVALLAAVPIYARGGWFVEDVLRHPEAPNGTIELLFDHLMRSVAAEGSRHVTYGLAPLAGTPSRVLRFVRDHTRWLYHFEGLRSFKAKLQPDSWHPVYLGHPRGELGLSAVVDVLAAFARGSFIRFGLATLRHRAAGVTRLLALLLVPWTLAMAYAGTAPWFPSIWVKAGWITFDLVLFVLLMRLATQWHRRLAVAIAGLAFGDFLLGCAQLALHNSRVIAGFFDYVIVFLALMAPLFATVFLWFCRDRAHLYEPEKSARASL